ncbi:MAG: hypothetical protein IPK26_23195 [Planctomycetes bacterium]|nr:hypothetical protein [Planctomycetota bacterium]
MSSRRQCQNRRPARRLTTRECRNWTKAASGKTSSRWLGSADVAIARQQVEAGQRLRAYIQALCAASEQSADDDLDAHKAASTTAVEEMGSPENSKLRSDRKSEP